MRDPTFSAKFKVPSNKADLNEVVHPPSRHAEEEEEGAGHVGGLRAWRGEPGRLAAQRGQPHLGAPVGAGENGAAARGGSSESRRQAFFFS